MKLDGGHVMITGGGSGLGRCLVDGFSDCGSRVGVLEQNPDRVDELNSGSEGSVSAWTCDVTSPESIASALQKAESAGFLPELLINNAGIIHSEPLINLMKRDDRKHSIDNWSRVLAADLDSVFFVTREVVERMMARRCKGVVVSISSISAAGNAGQGAYSAAKAGVNALMKAWASELGPMGLRFASIAPGFMDTPSTRQALSETVIARIQQQIPLKKLGSPNAVFEAARYIAENDYVTGTVLEVDGGLTL